MTSTPVAYLLIGMVLGAGIALLVSALIRRLGRWLTLHSAHRGMDPIEAGETADLPVESDEGMNAQRAQLRDPVDG